MTTRPLLLVLLRPALYRVLFDAEADRTLRRLAEVTFNTEERDPSSAELAARIGEFEIVVTGWGTPPFTSEVLEAAGRLRLVAHSAGSVKHMLPPALFERGVAVTHAAAAIAPAVAEMSLLLTLLMLRHAHAMDRRLKEGRPWAEAQGERLGEELAGTRVGVLGAGYTGRAFIRLLLALGAEVWVSDPYLSEETAREMGVQKVTLEALLSGCRVVSLQAPSTPETYHLLGARELAWLADGAVLINTARSWLVDQEALLAELRRGRIWAALDVFDAEPLPQEHPLRQLENALLTPHVAGATAQARQRQGRIVVEEIARFLAGEPLRYPVTRAMLDRMA